MILGILCVIFVCVVGYFLILSPIFNLIKMEVQRIEKEQLKEKNPFPL